MDFPLQKEFPEARKLIGTTGILGVTERDWPGEGVPPMPDIQSDQEIEVVETTREQGRAMLDRAARDELGLSADQFLTKWDAGGYDDADDPAVTRVAMLIPFAR